MDERDRLSMSLDDVPTKNVAGARRPTRLGRNHANQQIGKVLLDRP